MPAVGDLHEVNGIRSCRPVCAAFFSSGRGRGLSSPSLEGGLEEFRSVSLSRPSSSAISSVIPGAHVNGRRNILARRLLAEPGTEV